MKKIHHVKKSSEIETILKYKHFSGSKFFTVYKMENSETSIFRYALSVGKKIGNAVTRNRVKRQIRNILAELIISKDVNLDIFIIARADVLNLSYSEMKKEIESLLIKQNIIKKEK